VLNVLFNNCPDCGGTGVRELGSVGDPRSNPRARAGAPRQEPRRRSSWSIARRATHVGIQRRVVYHWKLERGRTEPWLVSP
jgi:hypothetical protein